MDACEITNLDEYQPPSIKNLGSTRPNWWFMALIQRNASQVEDYLLQPLGEMGIEASAKVLHCYRKVGILG